MSIARKWIWRLMLFGPVLLLVGNLGDMISYLVDGDDYPIGWEGGGWRYRTPTTFFLSRVLDVVIMTAVLIGMLRARYPLLLWSARGMASLVTVPLILFLFVLFLGWIGMVPMQLVGAIQEGNWSSALSLAAEVLGF